MPKTEALCFIQLGRSRLETEDKQFLFFTFVKLYTGVVQYSNKRVGKIKFSIIIMLFNEHPPVFTIPDWFISKYLTSNNYLSLIKKQKLPPLTYDFCYHK